QDNVTGRRNVFADEPIVPIIESVAPLTSTARNRLELLRDWVETKIAPSERNRLGFWVVGRMNFSSVGAGGAVNFMIYTPDETVLHVFDNADAKPTEDLPANIGLS